MLRPALIPRPLGSRNRGKSGGCVHVDVTFGDLGCGVVAVSAGRVVVDHRCSYFDAQWLLDGVVPSAAVDDLFLPPMTTVDRLQGPLDQTG